MTRLLYLANNRLPTEKAHGLQIVQMCEALADAGYSVTLAAPGRFNTPDMRAVRSIWEHYGVAENFVFRRLPCLDLFPLFPRYHVALLVQTFTYLLAILLWPAFWRAEILYTRDFTLAAVMGLTRPRARLVYEVHQMHRSWIGRRVQAFLARRAAIVAITGHLADQMRARGAPPDRVLVAHDGVRRARFASVPDQAEARARIGWPSDAFIVGWVGRLHLMGMDKGVGLLVDALSQNPGGDLALAVVGGPDNMVEALRQRWAAAGGDPVCLLIAGQVAPDQVPLYLSACDVCAMPHPWTDHFAYATSPIKLFEYMASGRAIVASDLPGFAEVLRHEDSALLVPPGDAAALKAVVVRLRDDPALRDRLAARARELALSDYTWETRARRIQAHLNTIWPV